MVSAMSDTGDPPVSSTPVVTPDVDSATARGDDGVAITLGAPTTRNATRLTTIGASTRSRLPTFKSDHPAGQLLSPITGAPHRRSPRSTRRCRRRAPATGCSVNLAGVDDCTVAQC